jgi:hypothetical protein
MSHFYQVIRSNKLFVIHEYMFGVRSTNSCTYPIDDLARHMSKIPHHFQELATIRTNDKGVRDNADMGSH